MRRSLHSSRLPLLGAAALLLTGIAAGPVNAQVSMTDPDDSVACGAFARGSGGAWAATAPSRLDFTNGMSLAVRPGQIFSPNQTVGGVEVSAVLDRHCGNI
ncbi:MAG TPA: hypothetical protein VJR70_02485 [Stellaceae bacterium]|nr:hypothetical protein [Stellaceae bacterium]